PEREGARPDLTCNPLRGYAQGAPYQPLGRRRPVHEGTGAAAPRRGGREGTMTRRELIAGAGSALACMSLGSLPLFGAQAGTSKPKLRRMGGEGPGFAYRRRAGNFDIIEHCHALGLGVARISVPRDPGEIRALREKLDRLEMRVIVSVSPPRSDAD